MTIHSGTVENFACADAVRCRVNVAIPRARAFESFRHDIFHWWPQDETWSGESIEDIFFEGRKGGVLWERGPEGYRIDMARVLRWMPPEWIVLRWHVGPNRTPEPNPARASEVEIRFFDDGTGGTRIELEHRHFSRHGDGAEKYRARMGGEKGWPRILKNYAEHCGPKLDGVKLEGVDMLAPALASVTTLRPAPALAAQA
ncbi:MAG TPA: SRPBCC family protein [Rhizomicrobium sp.]|jgi:uncharacterized protein YndB with AHSA1/START domain